jgi:hypothetical protein
VQLARLHPDIKFIRARASSLGFASLSDSSKAKREVPYGSYLNRPLSTVKDYDGEDEIDDGKHYDDSEEEESDVDLDMLPTLLVYRDGELVYNWVRVDWEAGTAGVRDLLER